MFEEGDKKGSQSNSDLHKARNTHINNLKFSGNQTQKCSPLEPLRGTPEVVTFVG